MALPLIPILLGAGVVTLVVLSRNSYISKLKSPPLNYPPFDLADKSDAGIVRSFQANYNDGGYSVTFPVPRPLQVNGILDDNTKRAIDEAVQFMRTRPDLNR